MATDSDVIVIDDDSGEEQQSTTKRLLSSALAGANEHSAPSSLTSASNHGMASPSADLSAPTTPSNLPRGLHQLDSAPHTPRPAKHTESELPPIEGEHEVYVESDRVPDDGMDVDAPSGGEDADEEGDGEAGEGEAEGDESDSEHDSDDSGDEEIIAAGLEEDISHSPLTGAQPLPLDPESNGDATASVEPGASHAPDHSTAVGTGAPAAPTETGDVVMVNGETKPVNILKPKMKRTVRLNIKLEAAEARDRVYEFDLAEIAAEHGFNLRPIAPVVKIDEDTDDEKGGDSAEEMAKRFEAQAAAEDEGKKKKKARGRKRKYEEEQYDLLDGWIDDTELAFEERKFVAETKQKGYYVSLGDVALKKLTPPPGARTPNKPGPKPRSSMPVAPPAPPPQHPPDIPLSDRPISKRTAICRSLAALPGKMEARHSKAMKAFLTSELQIPPVPEGKIVVKGYEVDAKPRSSDDTNDNAMDEDEPEAESPSEPSGRGIKRKVSMAAAAAADGAGGSEDVMGEPIRKRRRGTTMSALDFAHQSFTPNLVAELELLKTVVEREAKAFGVKGKFPQHVKPLLAQIAMRAVVRDEYDDPFWDAMPKIFPYNRFTMKKLIIRTVYGSHSALLHDRTEELLVELKKITNEGFIKAQEDQKLAMEAWEAKQAKKKADQVASAETSGPPVAIAPTDLAASTGGGEHANGTGAVGKKDDDKPPQQKYRMNESLRTIIWDLVCISNDIVSLANEKNKFENSAEQVSEQGQRKVLYQKIQAAFPDGWMNSSILSREVSLLKRKEGERNMAEAAKSTS
ncbi:hypothetical protein BKA62DRAFT_718208 [Auriculariales sp. MPI-PUGE-AT-0066]|nr:hypothetical protein BKA62DRAFT_718208 [Auriculariales sp. MPI-PUGE-AT-0066]